MRSFGLGKVQSVGLSLNSDGQSFKPLKLELGVMKD